MTCLCSEAGFCSSKSAYHLKREENAVERRKFQSFNVYWPMKKDLEI
jgi:hypothetical protein